ncbi:hypothetical protein [Citrobacter freundii]|uniref:hypothetical protein n=1 Tax=Citrobacter freundii TaxID=546 RepID=UPI003C6F41B8
MKMNLIEMEGLLHGNGIPGDLKVNESNASYLVRKFSELEDKCAALAAKLKQSQIDAGCYKHGMEASNARLVQVAAENAGLNEKMNKLATWPGIEFYSSAWEFNGGDGDTALEFMCDVKTPATDAFLAEVRASARNDGINYAASRLAAAFNHGFVDKPLAEVCDVVRMILDTKEELANSTLPAADGISGEYAEKFLAEFAAQLRKGVQS